MIKTEVFEWIGWICPMRQLHNTHTYKGLSQLMMMKVDKSKSDELTEFDLLVEVVKDTR